MSILVNGERGNGETVMDILERTMRRPSISDIIRNKLNMPVNDERGNGFDYSRDLIAYHGDRVKLNFSYEDLLNRSNGISLEKGDLIFSHNTFEELKGDELNLDDVAEAIGRDLEFRNGEVERNPLWQRVIGNNDLLKSFIERMEGFGYSSGMGVYLIDPTPSAPTVRSFCLRPYSEKAMLSGDGRLTRRVA